MGCASSKKVCKNCKAGNSPVRRSYSMTVHHHQHQETGDIHHMVALTSSTLGSLSLQLDPLVYNHVILENKDNFNVVEEDKALFGEEEAAKEEFAMGMIEAKTWSNMINEKIPKIVPKTPIQTPPGEPEMIDAWEMMEGLEDISPLRPIHHFRSFSFQVPHKSSLCSIDDQPTPRVKENGNGNTSPKPSWLDSIDTDSNSNSNDTTSEVSEFDPEVIATLRRALEDFPPTANHPFNLKPLDHEKKIVPRGNDKLIVYFTSLRGVRKTFEDSCHVRVILNGLGVKVDERDVSMHSGFKEELKELLGEGFGAGGLPRVFIGRTYIGGADEIRRLNEEGKLEKMVENCELIDGNGGGGNGNVCEACGDVRFMPCETCSGSCKIYYDEEEEEEEEEEGLDDSELEYGFHRCPDCNENGLVRCPICCD
ncbi:hypothetical protein ACJIZ3_002050 [Penstemon smallii]|uniref:Glutaredoxin domain-containing protein n=1 Tax=Penstemon smallii TaxID=265156 RepID=A0ABD3U6I1_9LAMI